MNNPQEYIGVKIVEATPDQYRDTGQADLVNGYSVLYGNHHESWSPKKAFEDAYVLTNQMTFGLALEAARQGRLVARRHWLPDRYVYFQASAAPQVSAYMVVLDSAVAAAYHPGVADLSACDWHIVKDHSTTRVTADGFKMQLQGSSLK